LLFVLVAGLYAPSVHYGFIYDDHVLFATTPVRDTAEAYADLLREPHFGHLPYYRPLARATFELQKLWHGARPAPFHLFNALAAGLLALAAWRLLARPGLRVREPFGWLAAALFALHPIASSSVYPATGRETLLSTALVLVAVASFLRARPRWNAVALGAFALALLCHEQAIVLPALLLLADACGLREVEATPSLARRARSHAPFALTALAFLAVRASVLGAAGGFDFALREHPTGPLLSLGYALTSIFAPTFRLAYEAPLEVWAHPARLAVAGGGLVAVAVASGRARTGLGPRGLFWAGWFLIALLPTSNVLVQETTRFAERWVCLAWFGAAALLATLCSERADRGRAQPIRVASFTAALLLCGAMSYTRGLDHADDLTFMRRWVASNPRSAQARASLGGLLFYAGERNAAEEHMREAIHLLPDYADAQSNLGLLLWATGRLSQGLPHLRRAVELEPESARYAYNLGRVLVEAGQREAARYQLQRSLERAPDFAPARALLRELQGEPADG
jgi:Tfp pilus assembly protein PilF